MGAVNVEAGSVGDAPSRPDWAPGPARPVLGTATCDVWRIDLEALAVAGGGDPENSPLDAAERERARRFVFDRHRRWYTAARTALRSIVGGYLGLEPAAVPIELEELGRPRLAPDGLPVALREAHGAAGPLDFNLSHTDGLALLAVAHGGPLGVDVEQLREMNDAEALAKRFFAGDEIDRVLGSAGLARQRAFFLCWTRKEAVLKSTGVGLTVSTRSVHVGATPESRTLDFRSKESVVPLVLHSFEVRDGAFGACAVAPAVTRLAFHDFGPGLG